MLRFCIFFFTLVLLLSCKKASNNLELSTVNKKDSTITKVKTETEKLKYSKEDFDFILKDKEDINWHPKGLLVMKSDYLPNYNDIGNILFYTFSKLGALKWQEKMDDYSEEETEVELERIKNLSLDAFKKEFEIYAFVIDKQYIKDTPEGPYQKETYVKELYHCNDKDIWRKIDSFEVKKEDNFLKEREWSKRKLAELVN
ncbi:hypothetical protein ACJRPK_16415 [Aquimarina sp. 2-A2]|uniref:hypothetical protein n=1 Tax=Aquimarina sp. 2-A2 TaxID=3382644 RepID=UPI00387EEEA5